MNDRIIIKNGTIVTMNDADDVIFGGTVVIEDDRITDVGTASDVAGRFDEGGAVVIDATDKAVMPGLVDLHYHTALGKGWSDHLRRPAGIRSSEHSTPKRRTGPRSPVTASPSSAASPP